MKKQTLSIRIAKILLIIMIPLLLVVVGLLAYDLITGHINGIIRNILVSIFLIEMLWFCFIIFTCLTKYPNEFLLNDYEMKEKWDTLSPEFKKFHITGFDKFSFIFYSTLILFGLSEILIYKNWNGLNSLIIGIGLGLVYLRIRRNRLK